MLATVNGFRLQLTRALPSPILALPEHVSQPLAAPGFGTMDTSMRSPDAIWPYRRTVRALSHAGEHAMTAVEVGELVQGGLLVHAAGDVGAPHFRDAAHERDDSPAEVAADTERTTRSTR